MWESFIYRRDDGLSAFFGVRPLCPNYLTTSQDDSRIDPEDTPESSRLVGVLVMLLKWSQSS